MPSHLFLTLNEGYLAIPEKYDKLIVSLRTAQAKEYDRSQMVDINNFKFHTT